MKERTALHFIISFLLALCPKNCKNIFTRLLFAAHLLFDFVANKAALKTFKIYVCELQKCHIVCCVQDTRFVFTSILFSCLLDRCLPQPNDECLKESVLLPFFLLVVSWVMNINRFFGFVW